MLNSIDILIGFSVIMLMVSMSVTLINQWILTLLKMRGKKLLDGVKTLLNQIAPDLLTEEHARNLADQVLRHPLAGRGGKHLAEVIQREDLIKIVLEIGAKAAARMPQPQAAAAAVGGAAAPAAPPPGTPPSAAEQALVLALQRTGIPDPQATLDAVRTFSMRLEASQPELATHVREAKALIMEAESQFVARINGWFDQTMDAVSHSFAKYSHYWTVAISLVLAVGLQIDAIKLVNRLAVDDNLRARLVEQAQTMAPPPVHTAQDNSDAEKELQDLSIRTRENVIQLREMATAKLVTWPPYGGDWRKGWQSSSVFGVLLAGFLISLGAPFWFNMLGNLLKLRPQLAAKEDQQRAERQTSQAPPGGGGAPPTATGERGDLTAG